MMCYTSSQIFNSVIFYFPRRFLNCKTIILLTNQQSVIGLFQLKKNVSENVKYKMDNITTIQNVRYRIAMCILLFYKYKKW
jgi:hypothetical protein